MKTIPILYRAAIYTKRKREEILGEPVENREAAFRDAHRLAAAHPAKVILILKSDKWLINAGKFFLHHVIK